MQRFLKTEDGAFELDTLRGRPIRFEPRLAKKQQARFTPMNDEILSLYTKEMTTREIVTSFKEMYAASVLSTRTAKVTDSVIDRITE